MNARTWLCAGVVLLGLHGCGGGSGSGGNASTPADGRTALNRLVTGQQAATQQNLQSVLTLFQQTLHQNPSSTDALFGSAVCLAGLVAQQIDADGSGSAGATGSGSGTGSSGTTSISGGTPPAAPSNVNGGTPPAPPGYNGPVSTAPPVHIAGLFWNLQQSFANPDTLLQALAPVVDLRYGLMPFFGYPGDDVSGRQQMLTNLTTVDQDLQTIEANPNFTTTLPDPQGSGATLTVGLPEVYLFDSYVNNLRAQIALSLAYIRDTTASNTSGGTTTSSATSGLPMLATAPTPPVDLNHDGKLEPSEYLPPSPYLTLRDPSLVTTAQQALQEVVSNETKGIAGVFARPSDGSGGYLVPNSANIHSQLASIQSTALPLLQQSLTGPVTLQIPQLVAVPATAFASPAVGKSVTVGAALHSGTRLVFAGIGDMSGVVVGTNPLPQPTYLSVTINLAAWFTNPPPDLKVFAPTYPLDSNGYPIYSQAVYPDPTFGGLFPNGLPSGLLF